MKRKRVVVLGATGSIGESALKVARDIPERMEIVGLAANSNAEKLAAAANETRAPFLCLVDETKMEILRRALAYSRGFFQGRPVCARSPAWPMWTWCWWRSLAQAVCARHSRQSKRGKISPSRVR